MAMFKACVVKRTRHRSFPGRPCIIIASRFTRCSLIGVTLKGHTAVFRHSQHHLPKDEVVQLRKFVETCGIDPVRDYPL